MALFLFHYRAQSKSTMISHRYIFGGLLLWVMCGQRGRSENDCSHESLLGRRSSHRGDETGRANDLFPDRIP